jgi:hypothetical protein
MLVSGKELTKYPLPSYIDNLLVTTMYSLCESPTAYSSCCVWGEIVYSRREHSHRLLTVLELHITAKVVASIDFSLRRLEVTMFANISTGSITTT